MELLQVLTLNLCVFDPGLEAGSRLAIKSNLVIYLVPYKYHTFFWLILQGFNTFQPICLYRLYLINQNFFRLIENSELPDYLLADPEEESDEETPEDKEKREAVELGRGNRSKKETNYDDQMSEKEWLKVIGE